MTDFTLVWFSSSLSKIRKINSARWRFNGRANHVTYSNGGCLLVKLNNVLKKRIIDANPVIRVIPVLG